MGKGETLEQSVSRFEKVVAPHGLSVVRRHIERDVNGTPEAEFDVFVTGETDESDVRWIIECRDRPSQGPAPASWIEQLMGRRQRFNADKVIAVSTTGFSSPALKLAKEQSIPTRTVEYSTDAVDELFVQKVRWCLFEIRLSGDCRIKMEGDSKSIHIDNPETIRLCLDDDLIPLTTLIWKFWSHSAAWGDEWSDSFFHWQSPNDENLIEMAKPQSLRVTEIECPIEVVFEEKEYISLLHDSYEENGQNIARELQYSVLIHEGEIFGRLIFGYRQDINKWALTSYFPERIPQEYSSNVMIIRPEGFQDNTVSFPLGEIVFTALKSLLPASS